MNTNDDKGIREQIHGPDDKLLLYPNHRTRSPAEGVEVLPKGSVIFDSFGTAHGFTLQDVPFATRTEGICSYAQIHKGGELTAIPQTGPIYKHPTNKHLEEFVQRTLAGTDELQFESEGVAGYMITCLHQDGTWVESLSLDMPTRAKLEDIIFGPLEEIAEPYWRKLEGDPNAAACFTGTTRVFCNYYGRDNPNWHLNKCLPRDVGPFGMGVVGPCVAVTVLYQGSGQEVRV